MKKKDIIKLISFILCLILVFPLSMMVGFYAYDNTPTLTSGAFNNIELNVVGQSIETKEAMNQEYWDSLVKDIDAEFQNTAGRFVQGDDVAAMASSDHTFPISIMSATPSTSDRIYATNHIYLTHGDSWASISESGVYMSQTLAFSLIETGIYGSIGLSDFVGQNVTLRVGSTELALTVGGLFNNTAATYARYYANTLETEIVYISLENTFKLDTSSTKGFITYENSSNRNYDVYQRIVNDEAIKEQYLHSSVLRERLAYIQNYRTQSYIIWLCLLFTLLAVADAVALLILSKKVFAYLQSIDNEKLKFLNWMQRRENYYFILLAVGFAIACLCIAIGKSINLPYLSLPIPFINTGSMAALSISFLLICAVLWVMFGLKRFVDDSFHPDEIPEINIATRNINDESWMWEPDGEKWKE